MKFDGETMSSHWRAAKVTTCWWCLVTPRTPLVALCHHCCSSRNAWWMKLNGHCCQAGSEKRRSWGSGSMQRRGAGRQRFHAVEREAMQLGDRLLGELLLLAGVDRKVHQPVHVRPDERRGRQPVGHAPYAGVDHPIEVLGVQLLGGAFVFHGATRSGRRAIVTR